MKHSKFISFLLAELFRRSDKRKDHRLHARLLCRRSRAQRQDLPFPRLRHDRRWHERSRREGDI